MATVKVKIPTTQDTRDLNALVQYFDTLTDFAKDRAEFAEIVAWFRASEMPGVAETIEKLLQKNQ